MESKCSFGTNPVRNDLDSDHSMYADTESSDTPSDNSSDTSFDDILRTLNTNTTPDKSTQSSYTIPTTKPSPATIPDSNPDASAMDTTTESSSPSTTESSPKPPPVAYDSDDSFCSIDEMIAEARALLNKSHTHDDFHPVRFTWKETIHPNSNI